MACDIPEQVVKLKRDTGLKDPLARRNNLHVELTDWSENYMDRLALLCELTANTMGET